MFFFIAKLNSPRARRAPMNTVGWMERFESCGQRRAGAETAVKDASGWKQRPWGRSVPCSPPRVNKRSGGRKESRAAGYSKCCHRLSNFDADYGQTSQRAGYKGRGRARSAKAVSAPPTLAAKKLRNRVRGNRRRSVCGR